MLELSPKFQEADETCSMGYIMLPTGPPTDHEPQGTLERWELNNPLVILEGDTWALRKFNITDRSEAHCRDSVGKPIFTPDGKPLMGKVGRALAIEFGFLIKRKDSKKANWHWRYSNRPADSGTDSEASSDVAS